MPFLVAAAVDQLANTCPDRRFALVAEHADSTADAKDVTWADFRRSVDRTAAWIESKFGRPESGNPTLGFMSTPFDFRYSIFLVAAVKLGYKLFMPSPRNSPEFHLHLISKERLDCTKFISAVPLGDWASACSVVEAPSLDELLDPASVKPFPYTKTWDEAKDDEVVAVHSSGSTGPPKPIVWTNDWLDAMRDLMNRKTAGEDLFKTFTQDGDSRLIAMPQFHTAGLLVGPLFSIMVNSPMTLFPSSQMLTAGNATAVVQNYDVRTAFLPPSILEDISVDPKRSHALGKLTAVGFGGGPLASEAGAILSKYTKLYTAIGSSEAGMYPMVKPNIEDPYLWWEFDNIPGFVFEPQGDGLYELVFKRQPEFHHAVFDTFPSINEYHTNDLYEPHASVENVWKLISRKDDVLVLSNGEKAVPMPMEDVIRLAPEVIGVLYSGQGRPMVSAVIELTSDAQKKSADEIRAVIAPLLDHANEIAPAFARLTPNMITFTTPDKPMKRTGKGSFIRKAVLKDYATELDALYGQESASSNVKLVDGLDEAGTVAALTKIFKELSGKSISPNQDLFQSAGIDSMQVLVATRVLKASVTAEASKDAKVSPGLIYDHPTITELAQAVRSLVADGSTSGDDHMEAMNDMLLKYAEGLDAIKSASTSKRTQPEVVILTGSTGSLGSYMLDILIRDPSIRKIHALNRSENAASRQATSNLSRGLITDFEKVAFHTADFGSKNFGVSPDVYRDLLDADVAIHNAWSVDFNQSLSSFEPHIRGVRNFIDLSSASARSTHVVFISSIGTTSMWDAFYPGQNRPEALLRDARVAAGQGYGEGKYVSEHLLNAAGAAGVSATICRVGQVGGPVQHGLKGSWNKQEWLPSIIASSKFLGMLPDTVGNDVANWVPVDSMAQAVVELGIGDSKRAAVIPNSQKGSFDVYNLVNPKGGKYSALIDAVRTNMPEIKQVVSFKAWVKALQSSIEKSDNDASINPATKLFDFYEGLVGHGMPEAFDTAAAVAHSKEMRHLDAVKPEWMDIWMKQWAF